MDNPFKKGDTVKVIGYIWNNWNTYPQKGDTGTVRSTSDEYIWIDWIQTKDPVTDSGYPFLRFKKVSKFNIGDIVKFLYDLKNVGITKGDKAVIVSASTSSSHWRVTMIEKRGISNTKHIRGDYQRLLFSENNLQLCSPADSQSVVEAVYEIDSNQSLIAMLKPASYPCPVCGSPGTPGFNSYWCSNRNCPNGS